MPIKAIDYNKTIIYKLVCKDLNVTDLYVGSTTDFTKRKNSHKTCCINENNKSYNLKVYTSIRENGGWNNWTMLEIEKFECADGNEARARERHWYEELGAKMNTNLPIINAEERKKYYADHAEERLQYQKKYYEEHAEDQKKYYEEHAEERIQYQKKYNAEHAEERKRYARERYAQSKQLKTEL